jgi:P27 family predicted phage terminase small subunit
MRGSAAHDPQRLNRAEPKLGLATADAKPPRWLALSRRAGEAWRDLFPIVRDQMAILTPADIAALALLCEALANSVEERLKFSRDGSTYSTSSEDGRQMIRAHPSVAQSIEWARLAKVMLSEFGLTPSARSKVSRVDGATKDPLERWLDEGTGS